MLRRSALFVPAGEERFYRSASRTDADVIVFDLEDSIRPGDKASARGGLRAARERVQPRYSVVRVNSEPELLLEDLQACAHAEVDEVLLPKVESAQAVARLGDIIDRIEGWEPAVSVLVESLVGIRGLPDLLGAGVPLATVALGLEDLSAELSLCAPSRADIADLAWVHGHLLLWAASSGAQPLGIMGDIANFSDLGLFEASASAAWRGGYRGTYCIHPSQIPIANRAYAPDDEDVRWAQQVAEQASSVGKGSFQIDGRMIDAPTAQRAQRILEYAAEVRASSRAESEARAT